MIDLTNKEEYQRIDNWRWFSRMEVLLIAGDSNTLISEEKPWPKNRNVDGNSQKFYPFYELIIERPDIASNRPSEAEEEQKLIEESQKKKLLNFKKERKDAVDNLIVEVSTGKKFDGNEEAQRRMLSAIKAAEFRNKSNTDTLEWSTADVGTGVMVEITLLELKEAHALSIEKMGEIWALPS